MLCWKGSKIQRPWLLIIDEEQKFGVGHKEKIKTLRTAVDCLTLTATPIPRTLQFSLMGARDLSIINTPPPNRQPIQTEVQVLMKILSAKPFILKRKEAARFFYS
jgi:transcription-repair coupling factor (superfamily II helicase)